MSCSDSKHGAWRRRAGCAAKLAGVGALLLVWPTEHAWARPPLHAQGTQLVDAAGGTLTLRGLNLTTDAKLPPFRPLDDPRLLDALPAWGVNVVRLLFTWEAYEPERERFDASYLDYIESVIDACQARGAWVILDVHQDAFSRFSVGGCGEGFPRWALPRDVAPETPDNADACVSWNLQMLVDLDMHRAWQAFHANEGGVRDRYLALLDTLGRRFGGHPNVIGFDMLNEPWGDEAEEIGPLYEDAARVLRASAPETLLFVSPHALTSGGLATALARPSFDNFVFSPHYYDGTVLLLQSWGGGDLGAVVEGLYDVSARWGAPLLLGELGAPAATEGGLAYLDGLYAALDRRFASAAQWGLAAHFRALEKDGWNREDLSVVDEQGQMRANYRVRPFAPRVAGQPGALEVEFVDRERAASVSLAWEHDPARGSTRLFVGPAALFGGAVRIEQTGEQLVCQLARDGLHIVCDSPSAGSKTLRVLPCALGDPSCLVAPPDGPVPVPSAAAPMSAMPAASDAPALGPARKRSPAGGCQLGWRTPARAWCGWLVALVLARAALRKPSPPRRAPDGRQRDC